MSIWPRAVLLCILTTFASEGAAQTATPRAKTTRSGVYSREQADRGQEVYFGMCKSCHTPESHTAAAFTTKWNGKPLSALYEYIRDQMPKNEPGSLMPEEYADVLAYVLKLNRMPAGAAELPSDLSALKTIRFDTSILVRKSP